MMVHVIGNPDECSCGDGVHTTRVVGRSEHKQAGRIGQGGGQDHEACREGREGMNDKSYETVLTRVLVRDHSRRRKAIDEAVAYIRSMEDRSQAIVPTIEHLVATRREDGLNIAMHLLLEVGEPILDYTEVFLIADRPRWAGGDRLVYDVNDDVVYVLLRTLGSAGLDNKRTIDIMLCCLTYGNPMIRDAAIWGLEDMGTEEAYSLIRSHGLKDCSALVRDSAKMVLKEQESM